MPRSISSIRRHLLGMLVLPAATVICLAGPDQPADQKDKAAPQSKTDGQTRYQARLLNADGGRVAFQVTKGGSTRIFSMLLADDARITRGDQTVGLRSMPADTPVTVSTARRDGLERVVAIVARSDDATTGQHRTSPQASGQPTGGKQSLAFPTGDRNTNVLLIETEAPDQVRVGKAFGYRSRSPTCPRI